eukprot:4680576-Pleurochrysis_carterae.AAC.1
MHLSSFRSCLLTVHLRSAISDRQHDTVDGGTYAWNIFSHNLAQFMSYFKATYSPLRRLGEWRQDGPTYTS